jgi:hypothetical protein
MGQVMKTWSKTLALTIDSMLDRAGLPLSSAIKPIRLPDPNSGLHLKSTGYVKVIRLTSQYGLGRQSHAVPLPFGYTSWTCLLGPHQLGPRCGFMTVWLRTGASPRFSLSIASAIIFIIIVISVRLDFYLATLC